MMNQREFIESAQNEARSELAKFIFDPKNRDPFNKILAWKPPGKLVAELNAESYPQEDLNELKAITLDWKKHRELFALPPEKLLGLILKKGLLQENLNFIRPLLEEKGVFNNLFKNILRVENLHERAKLLFVLANCSEMHPREVQHFLYTIRSPINKFQFKEEYLKCCSLLKKTRPNPSEQPPIEVLLNYQSRRLNDDETNETVNLQIDTAQSILKEWSNVLLIQTLSNLIKPIEKNATSNVAKFVLDSKNLEKMAAIITSEPLDKLLPKLNSFNVPKEKLDQLNVFSSNKDDYTLLFKTPPMTWLTILLQEKIESQDLTSLIGSDGMGAVSGLLEEINELPDILDRARAFNYLLNSKKESKNSIKLFFETLGLPESNRDSFFRLHHIVHNLKEYTPEEDEDKFDTVVPHRTAIECVLGITPPDAPHFALPLAERKEIEDKNSKIIQNNLARINAASRITIECVKALLEKNKLSLDETQLKKFHEEKDALFAKELQNEGVPEKKKISNYNDPLIFFIHENPELFQDLIGNLRQVPSFPIFDESKFHLPEEKAHIPEVDSPEDVELQRAILLSLDTAAAEEKQINHSATPARMWK